MRLDDDYANAPYIEDSASYPDRWAKNAESFRSTLCAAGRARLGVMYGHGPRNALDLFMPLGRAQGLLVFVHGGYWLKFDRSYWSHLAQGALDQGWAVAMPSYDLCPRVRISDITRQIADAITVAAHDVTGPVILSGHSAGGHLVSRMLEYNMLPDDVFQRLRHVVPISAVSDLRPLLETSMNKDFGLSPQDAADESPVLMPKPGVPVTVWVGADERPAFLEQSKWLSAAWGAPLVIEPGTHHFDVIEGLADGDSRMVRTVLQI
ncbi:MAG: alpha/beta hydrolase fold domain-containing protein [Rhodobacteraceae bacterium]|nr:alpha/beta hydrolase fold domain-containing protein [Paracoccaceae bacterium]